MEYSDRATLDSLLWEGDTTTFRELAVGLKGFTIEGAEAQIACPVLALTGSGEGPQFERQAQLVFDNISSKTRRIRGYTAGDGDGAHCQAGNALLMNREGMSRLDEELANDNEFQPDH